MHTLKVTVSVLNVFKETHSVSKFRASQTEVYFCEDVCPFILDKVRLIMVEMNISDQNIDKPTWWLVVWNKLTLYSMSVSVSQTRQTENIHYETDLFIWLIVWILKERYVAKYCQKTISVILHRLIIFMAPTGTAHFFSLYF